MKSLIICIPHPVLFRRMKWAGNVACLWESRGIYRVLVRILREKDPLEDKGIDRRINIKMDIQVMGYGVWTGSIWLRTGRGWRHL
jgi:hypothetical protein